VWFKTRPLRSIIRNEKRITPYLKNIFGFYPGNIFLYKQAFKHKSIAKEIKGGIKNCNERLEYLGDAVLDAIVADFLFKKYPFEEEGFLTETRSKIVSRNQLNKLAQKLGVDKMVESDKYSKLTKRSLSGDALESLIGAIYLDKGYIFTRKIIIKRILKTHINIEELVETETNYKSRLIEWAQKEKREVKFLTTDIIVNNNNKLYEITIVIDGKPYKKSQHFSIKGAEQLSSEKTWKELFEEE
jgi:ribonuclease III